MYTTTKDAKFLPKSATKMCWENANKVAGKIRFMTAKDAFLTKNNVCSIMIKVFAKNTGRLRFGTIPTRAICVPSVLVTITKKASAKRQTIPSTIMYLTTRDV